MTYTVTVQVADFDTTGPVPVNAFAYLARATVDVSGTVVVSTARQVVTLPGGVGTFTAEPGVAYQFQLVGVAGFDTVWYFQASTNCTAADLFREYQVDPDSLQPLPTYPTVAATIAAETSRAQAAAHTDAASQIATQAASDAATYPSLDSNGRLAIGGVELTPAAIGASSGGGGGGGGTEYAQIAAASTWGPITHGLGRRPAVTVFDSNGDEIAPDIHATTTTVSLVFATPVAGTAVLI